MPTTETRILALDLGTSSARALVLDGTATPLPGALARHKVEPSYADDGAATLDLDDYVAGLFGCVDSLDLTGVEAVVMSSQWHSIVALDDAGTPRTPLVPWVDTRSVPRRVSSGFDEHAFHRRTGSWLHRLYWTRRIPWIRSTLAELGSSASSVYRFAGVADLVLERLTGSPVTSVSMASGTGLLDVTSGSYDAEALDIAGVPPDRLPSIVPGTWTGHLVGEFARRWPELAGVPIHPATGDGAASNVGTGGSDESTAAVTVGTSAAVRVVHPVDAAPELPWELWRYRVDDQRAVTGTAFSAAGNLYAWLTGLLGPEPELDGIPPGSSRVIAIPFQAGSRPPETVPSGSGALFNLSFDDGPADVLAALLQGAALEVDRGLRMLDQLFDRSLAVVLGGGGAHASAWWRHCLAATFGRPVTLSPEAEVGARGAAAVALGLTPAPAGDTITPSTTDISRVAALKKPYAELRALAVRASMIAR